MNRIYLMPVNLKLFDGEETDAGEMVANNTDPAIDQQDDQSAEDQVVYGTLDTDDGSDTQDQNTDPQHDTTSSQPYKAFQTEEEWQKEIDGIMGRRLKDYREKDQKLSTYEPVVQDLMRYHKVSSLEDLKKFVDSQVIEDLAYQEGLTPEQYRKQKDLEAENARLKSQVEERSHNEFMDKVFSEADNLKKTVYPDLDMKTLVKNPKFTNLLANGFSVKEAYEAVNVNALLQKAAKAAQQNTVQNIRAKGMRIPENGTRQSPGVIVKDDPSKYTNADIDRIREIIRQGGTVKF